MKHLLLSGDWQVLQQPLDRDGLCDPHILSSPEADWIPARVPGEIHLDLMRAGRMEEPLFSTNMPECRWPEQYAWWYQTEIEVDAGFLQEECQELVFDGLDYFARVFLNGECVGEAENAFIPAVFDVTHRLREGTNTLWVRLTAGTERARNQTVDRDRDDPVRGHRNKFKGLPELRKPQFSYGYDWVDALPNIGIWRDVHLCGYSKLRIADVRTETLLDAGTCNLKLDVDIANLHPWADNDGVVELALTAPDGAEQTVSISFRAPVGITRVHTVLSIPDPQLWWPSGLGEQPLYTLSITARQGDSPRDVWEREIGLRTVQLNRAPLAQGSRFDICINGTPVFCKGGNWIPADAILARVDQGRYDALIQQAVDANLNMLRVWGGGVYESDHFYRACDRNGILVWQDFMFACHEYPDHRAAFREKIRHEAETVIRRLRHHPSIVLWCGNNENLVGFRNWWNKETPFPDKTLKLGGRHVYGRILANACLDLDAGRPYWPGSPAGGEDPNCETDGDCHWWHGTMGEHMINRHCHEFYDTCRSRFVSEYGIVGPCHIESCREFLREEELDPRHRAWQVHTNLFEAGTTPAAIRYHYAEPESLGIEDYIRYGQMFQAVMHGRTLESMRFRKDDPDDPCSGALIWMFNDCWGETGWTPIDYYLRRKPGYYWIRNACYPVRALVRRRNDQLVTRVVNDRPTSCALRVSFGFLRVDGTESRIRSEQIEVPANSMREIERADTPPELRPDEWIYIATCDGPGIEVLPCVWNLVPYRDLQPVSGELHVEVEENRIRLSSPVYRHGVRHHDGGEALFSDNYFDLIPGLPKIIHAVARLPESLRFEALNTEKRIVE